MKRALHLTLSALVILSLLLSPAAAKAAVLSGYTSKVDYDNTDPNKYYIEIDLVNQVISVYEKEAGSKGRLVLQGLCTTGSSENPTGSGTFKLGHLKERFGYFVAFGQWAQYWTQIVRGVYIHSVMYDSKSLSDMSKSAYNGLGRALSHGCVRVLAEHAQWIFYNCPPGTTCVITKKQAPDKALVKALKEKKPSYSAYKHPVDHRADPPVLSATVAASGCRLRTGFSSSRDKTLLKLKAGDTLKVLQLGPDWCKVQTKKGKLGYVESHYLSLNPEHTETKRKYAAAESTYLYASPSAASAKLFSYAKGADVEVLGTVDKNWLSAIYNGNFGYVRSGHLSQAQETSYEEKPETVIKPSLAVRGGIIANMRSGPGKEFEVVAELPSGTALNQLEELGAWYKVEASGLVGYVNTSCIEFI